MSFVQVVKMKPAYQKQNGHKNLVLTPLVTSEVTSYQVTCYPNPIHSKFLSPHPIVMRPSPRRYRMWHRSPCGPHVQVVPAPATTEAATRGWRLSPSSPQARHPISPHGAQGGCSHGYGYPPPHE
jgi:hypothetical protein